MALDLLIGPDELESGRVAITLPPARHEDLRDFRVAIWADATDFSSTGAIARRSTRSPTILDDWA
jgi:amidase